MARYWVGGSGTWDTTSTTNWSATSGGGGGASNPTATDDVFFDSGSSASSYVVSIATSGGTPLCKSISISGPASGTLTYGTTSYGVFCYGDLTIAATGVSCANAYFYMYAPTTSTITTNNNQISATELSTNAVFTLGSAYSGTMFIGNGNAPTLNTANFNFNCSGVTNTLTTSSGFGGILILGTSTITCSGLFSSFRATNAGSVSATSATFVMSGTGAEFSGAGFSFGTLTHSGSSKILTIDGSSTFTTISNTVQPCTFNFTSGTTQTVTNFSVSGTAGNLVTIKSSTSGSAATLSKASGSVLSDYLSIQDSTATGGATWNAGANSTNVSGNSGWIFSASVTSTGFLGLLLRIR